MRRGRNSISKKNELTPWQPPPPTNTNLPALGATTDRKRQMAEIKNMPNFVPAERRRKGLNWPKAQKIMIFGQKLQNSHFQRDCQCMFVIFIQVINIAGTMLVFNLDWNQKIFPSSVFVPKWPFGVTRKIVTSSSFPKNIFSKVY